MKAVQVREFGIEHIRVAEVADPSPGRGDVLIATEAATVNPADFAVITGAAAAPLPWVRSALHTGWELVGRVVAAGEGVGPSVIGSRVLGGSACGSRACVAPRPPWSAGSPSNSPPLAASRSSAWSAKTKAGRRRPGSGRRPGRREVRHRHRAPFR